MNVSMVDLQAQYETIREDVRAAVDRVLESQHFILGPEVSALEERTAEYCGVDEAIGVSSGTDALLVSLMALDVGPGDEVVTTPYTFFATAGAVARLGADPVFVDVDPDTLNMDPDAAMEAMGSRTAAVIPVHLFGRCVEMTGLLREARARGVPVIEDAAQAIGAVDGGGRTAGSTGRAGCFSFFPSKNLGGAGDGGMVVTDDPGLADRIRMLRVHGARPKYHHTEVGGNFRLDALQAAILRVKLERLPGWTEARRRAAHRYREMFADAGLSELVTVPRDEPGHVYNQFVVRVPERDELASELASRGIETAIYYPRPLHLQPCFRDLGYREGDFPVAESAAREALALPMFPEITPEQQRAVVGAVGAFYRTAGRRKAGA